jgi:hypothetical protein
MACPSALPAFPPRLCASAREKNRIPARPRPRPSPQANAVTRPTAFSSRAEARRRRGKEKQRSLCIQYEVEILNAIGVGEPGPTPSWPAPALGTNRSSVRGGMNRHCPRRLSDCRHRPDPGPGPHPRHQRRRPEACAGSQDGGLARHPVGVFPSVKQSLSPNPWFSGRIGVSGAAGCVRTRGLLGDTPELMPAAARARAPD